MRDILTAAEVAGALVWEPLVSSWLGGRWLADVPAAGGSVTWSTRREVPGSLDLIVPRQTPGADWLPGRDPAHPLAHFGQVLRVSVKITKPVSGEVLVVRLGTFRVTGWRDQGGTVSVTGVSMMQLIENARLRRPIAPRAGGTLASEARRLVPASLGATVAAGLTDRNCPSMTWGESRMDGLREIAQAWPARLRESEEGQVVLSPPLAAVPSPVLYLTDGAGGTAVSAYTTGTEDGLYNVVVARGTENDAAGAPLIQAEAEQTTGPLAVSGPFGEKPRFFSSPLLTSVTAAQAAADSMLADAVRQSLTVPVVCAPDPRIELDDAVEVLTDEGRQRLWGYVSGIQLPLLGDEDMRVDVEVAS